MNSTKWGKTGSGRVLLCSYKPRSTDVITLFIMSLGSHLTSSTFFKVCYYDKEIKIRLLDTQINDRDFYRLAGEIVID